ncbi:MAG: Uncharacterised protein [Formosa sp. Hel1_33_131]|nr:MAG: Uncharacterised protein [Formosa sp. Hel1_33_131]
MMSPEVLTIVVDYYLFKGSNFKFSNKVINKKRALRLQGSLIKYRLNN